MKRFKRILVATDTRHDHHPIVEAAAEIAKFNGASLKIIDVVPPFTWLSRHTIDDHEHLSKLIKEEKEEKVAALADEVRSKEIEVECKVVTGKPATEIIREVIRGEHDLLMAVSKGRNSTSDNYFGRTARRLQRQCPCAVWLVSPDSTSNFAHVLGCVDTASRKPMDLELNDKILELSKSISQYHDAKWSVLHAWCMEDESLLSARMKPEKVMEYEGEEQRYHKENLDKFLKQHDLSLESDGVHLVKGEASDSIEAYVQENSVDLLVMGTVARSGLGGFFVGNTAEEVLDRVKCSVLALKPYQFESSIKI